ncbi:cytosolic carboxypeptidase-like protein 5 isoform X1 [Diabrotica undecimpunctata]|uniref:cytosolic carboxypeptidase-like protein 5 isoform X1 n=1 Tax=Diabrotica undecimpunctata TaxID=50387 RepID=UPI003B6330AC
MAGISCSGFTFYNEFDSANLAKVEHVPGSSHETASKHHKNALVQEIIDAEFNLWTKPDCYGTEFENGNRTWFYFGVKAPGPAMLVKFNIVDLNRQGKMYSQGMAPVYRIVPGKPRWERIFDKPTHCLNDDIFTLSFKFRTPDNVDSVVYFAFTYPFSVTELEKMLTNVDSKYLHVKHVADDDIYYVRETVCHSCDGKPIDLITISSYHGISKEREEKLKHLFNKSTVPRPFKFPGKKVIFVSARVHPGETPSSFVFNGLLSLLLSKDDLIAQTLRKIYVFKLIPFLNPDGVSRGHYRTDSRGVNLNRVYLNPSLTDHPSVYAARALIRFYHFGYEKEDYIPKCDNCKTCLPGSQTEGSENDVKDDAIRKKVSRISLNEDNIPQTWCTKCKTNIIKLEDTMPGISSIIPSFNLNTALGHNFCRNCGTQLQHTPSKEEVQFEKVVVGAHGDINSNESGLFLYIDLHGHASKKGIFMYGNHFDDIDRNVECMLLPKLMSMNNHNFHFHACNFTERNMYLKDKRDGMSRAGSGRVAVLSLTGIIKSYTLECNYNTGRLVNILPPTIREPHGRMHTIPVPPKYTPQIFEEVGRSLGASILDLTGNNPFTRLPNSEFHSLSGLRDWLRTMSRELNETRPKKGKIGGSLTQAKSTRTIFKNRTSIPKPIPKKPKSRSAPIPLDRKENLAQPGSSKSGIKVNKQPFKAKTRKELTLKSKNSTEKVKPINKGIKKPAGIETSNRSKGKLETSTQIPTPVQSDKTKEEGVHLREICFINNSEGKAVIAKYENNDKFDDSLVVAWEKNSTHPQLYTRKARVFSAPPYHLPNKSFSEPGTSKQGGGFRVHNFAKTKARRNLRRLASAADILAKVDKKKKKKLKAK